MSLLIIFAALVVLTIVILVIVVSLFSGARISQPANRGSRDDTLMLMQQASLMQTAADAAHANAHNAAMHAHDCASASAPCPPSCDCPPPASTDCGCN